jgi:cobyrinic acid a,c-diamide synthase
MAGCRLIIAGTHSGVGKTTVALAVMAALRRRGLVVQPFKVGPDFIDPGHHAAVCERPGYNLDTWMVPEAGVRATFCRAAASANAAVIEGVMGLFDGRSADDPRGSTAHVARLLACPVVLVIDAASVAASVAAMVKGFCDLDPAVQVVGVICNRVAGTRHYGYLEPAIRRHTRVVPLGWLPRRPAWEIPERHLGLTTHDDLTAERRVAWQDTLDGMAQALEETVDVAALLELGACADAQFKAGAQPGPAVRPRRVAVARDAAFCFYYQENLDLLQAAGADVIFFSPMHDPEPPPDVDLVYLGGGYPELHAEQLAANHSMRAGLRQFHRRGGQIYAECGGLMVCGRDLVDGTGRTFPMLDLLPVRTVMQQHLAALGYVAWQATDDTLLGRAGTEIRGHEYHYSRLEALGPLQPAARLKREGQEARPDGFVRGSLLAGYAHLHLASNPDVVHELLGQD